MRRALAVACALALAAGPAAAQTVSERIGRDGLAATEAHLAALSVPTASDLFALGGVRFLRGVERALQTRYRHGLSDATARLPLLRLPVPDNPAPQPFRPSLVTEIFVAAAADMAAAREPLSRIADGDAVDVAIDMADLWFDTDGDGVRGAGESALAFLATIPARPGPAAPAAEGIVRFDTADVAWLAAYTHLIAGAAELVRAWDPTEAIADVTLSAATFDALSGGWRDGGAVFAREAEFRRFLDLITIVERALGQPADPAALAASRDHFRAMIAQNRRFWRLVALETDNDREWIPNARQTSALPILFPPETGESWLAVLAEIDAILTGDLLIPHWRLGPGAGINLARLVEAAPALDVLGVVQGVDVLPWAERGPVAGFAAIRAFADMTGPNMPLFVLTLN